MLNLSDILIGHPELESFDELVEIVRLVAQRTLLSHGRPPPYPDTPHNWEDILEGVFASPQPPS